MTRQPRRQPGDQSPTTAAVVLVAGWLAISGHRPDGLDQLQAALTSWMIDAGTEVLEAVARTQAGGAT